MPRPVNKDHQRVALRVRPQDKATLMRAVALEQTDLTSFILRTALRAAENVIQKAERVHLSERDGLRVMEMLENPPAPNAKLRAAAKALPLV